MRTQRRHSAAQPVLTVPPHSLCFTTCTACDIGWDHFDSKAAEATKSEGSLESWRSGASPVFRLDPDAIKEQRRQLGVTVAAVGAEVEPAESQGATSHDQLAMLD